MKSIVFIFTLTLSGLTFSQSTGICRAKIGSSHMEPVCRMQGEGHNGKQLCKMTFGCEWISITSVGVCTNTPGNEHMALLCRNQGNIGTNGEFCKMTRGCQWVELD